MNIPSKCESLKCSSAPGPQIRHYHGFCSYIYIIEESIRTESETATDSERNRDTYINSYINDKISGYLLNVLAMQFLPVGCTVGTSEELICLWKWKRFTHIYIPLLSEHILLITIPMVHNYYHARCHLFPWCNIKHLDQHKTHVILLVIAPAVPGMFSSSKGTFPLKQHHSLTISTYATYCFHI